MALVRGFMPAQFRDVVLGSLGPVPVSATIPSTAAGGNGTVAVTGVAGVLPGDVLFVIPYSGFPAGVDVEATVTAAGTVSLVAHNGGAGAFNPGAQTYTLVGFRFKTA